MTTTDTVVVSRRALQWALAVIESDPRWTDDPPPLIDDAPGGSDWQAKQYQALKAALTTTKEPDAVEPGDLADDLLTATSSANVRNEHARP